MEKPHVRPLAELVKMADTLGLPRNIDTNRPAEPDSRTAFGMPGRYFNDDGDLVALRYENWKFVFEEQRSPGTLQVWAEPFTKLRLPKLFDLLADPYERADTTSNTYYDWLLSQGYVIVAAQAVVGEFLASFQDYPPRQRAQRFSIDQIVEKMERSLEVTKSR
jgi:arylsulfatase A-like enzyme